MNLANYSSYFILSALISFTLNLCIINLWKNKKSIFLDYPDNRKKHLKPTLLLGGLSIYLSLFIMLFMILRIDQSKTWIYCLIGSIIIFLTGLVDDYYKGIGKELRVRYKSIGIGVTVLVTIIGGVKIDHIVLPFADDIIYLNYITQIIITFIWIFGIVTIINFTDGMDGLAGSISFIIGSTFFAGSLIQGQSTIATLSVILMGSLLGFLYFNKTPAKIFMGDSGALLIGYILAITSIEGYLKSLTFQVTIVPVLVMGLPIIDNVIVFINRFLAGKKLYKADRSQIHLKLQDRGFSYRRTYIFLVGITFLCALLATLIINNNI